MASEEGQQKLQTGSKIAVFCKLELTPITQRKVGSMGGRWEEEKGEEHFFLNYFVVKPEYEVPGTMPPSSQLHAHEKFSPVEVCNGKMVYFPQRFLGSFLGNLHFK